MVPQKASDDDWRQSEDVSEAPEEGAETGLESVEGLLRSLHVYQDTHDEDSKGLLAAINNLLQQIEDERQFQLDSAEAWRGEEEAKLVEELASKEWLVEEASRNREQTRCERERAEQDRVAVIEEGRAEAAQLRELGEREASAEEELGDWRVEVQALRLELRTQEENQDSEFQELCEQLERSRGRQTDIASLLTEHGEMTRMLDKVERSAHVDGRGAARLFRDLVGRSEGPTPRPAVTAGSARSWSATATTEDSLASSDPNEDPVAAPSPVGDPGGSLHTQAAQEVSACPALNSSESDHRITYVHTLKPGSQANEAQPKARLCRQADEISTQYQAMEQAFVSTNASKNVAKKGWLST